MLELFAFSVFYLAVVAYAALDGFDLGVGNLMLFVKGDKNRRIFLNAIGPVWDGNAVWIIISTGILFAGFPQAFALLTSAFYLPITFLLAGYMTRAAAIEFRSKHPSPIWRQTFDTLFCLSSLTVTLMLGMMIGNLIGGLPLDENYRFDKGSFQFYNPYAFVVGLLNVALFTMHGAIYLTMKTEGALQKQLKKWVARAIYSFLAIWLLATYKTFTDHPRMVDIFFTYPPLALVGVLALGTLIAIPSAERKGNFELAFAFSAVAIAILVTLVGLGLYPNIVPTSLESGRSLSLYQAAAGPITLKVVALTTLLGAPLSFFYIRFLYKVFRGKVEIGEGSY